MNHNFVGVFLVFSVILILFSNCGRNNSSENKTLIDSYENYITVLEEKDIVSFVKAMKEFSSKEIDITSVKEIEKFRDIIINNGFESVDEFLRVSKLIILYYEMIKTYEFQPNVLEEIIEYKSNILRSLSDENLTEEEKRQLLLELERLDMRVYSNLIQTKKNSLLAENLLIVKKYRKLLEDVIE